MDCSVNSDQSDTGTISSEYTQFGRSFLFKIFRVNVMIPLTILY